MAELAYNPQIVKDLWLSAKALLLDCPIRLALYQMYNYGEEQPQKKTGLGEQQAVGGRIQILG